MRTHHITNDSADSNELKPFGYHYIFFQLKRIHKFANANEATNMKKLFFSACLILFTAAIAQAQKTIAVLSGSNWTFYTDFSTALRQAPSGSTIYLPGGVFQLSEYNDTIDKTISIVGVGHYPDSTIATNKTTLDGSLYFAKGSDNSILEGFELTQVIQSMASTTQNNIVNNITIKRCKISSHNGIRTFENDSSYINNLNITESIVTGRITGNENRNLNLKVSNSILTDPSIYGAHYGATFINNLLFFRVGCSGCLWTMFTHCLFENNIINDFYNGSINQCILRNNLFLTNVTACSGCSVFTNNLSSTLSNTFVNAPTSTFNYSYNYNLLSNSVAKNAGTDGTDIGIYGTAYPYKPSAVPANPHISTKSIAPQSSPNGTLPVNIRVIAQDK